MATTSKKRDATPEEKQQAEVAYQQFFEEALHEPTKYLPHDINASRDEALSRLGQRYGMAYYGYYWLLVELLAGRRDCSYDVRDELGWERLAWDLSIMQRMTVDECKEFVAHLAELDLISREHFEELHLVTSRRVRRDREDYAREVAQKRLGGWRSSQKRLYG